MEQLDPDKLKLFSFMLFSKLEGAVTSGMVHLGDQLGIYKALAAAQQPLTTAQLAQATQLNERWVREWSYNQAAAKMISTINTPSSTTSTPSITDDTFYLSPEQTAVLATDNHPAFGMGMFHRLPQTMESLKRMPESFRTGMATTTTVTDRRVQLVLSAVSSRGQMQTSSRPCFPHSTA